MVCACVSNCLSSVMRKPCSSPASTMFTFCSRSMVDIRLKVQNYFGFTIDPIQTNRKRAPFMGASPATTKDWGVLTLPPQLMHMDFDPDGLVREFGFYVVNRRQGNTGELGLPRPQLTADKRLCSLHLVYFCSWHSLRYQLSRVALRPPSFQDEDPHMTRSIPIVIIEGRADRHRVAIRRQGH